MASSSDLAFTPSVKTAQTSRGSDAAARIEARGGFAERIDDALAGFIAERDSFYLGTASADGRPYIQHRGGAPGFLKVVDDRTLAFADFAGNRQYVSIGNLVENDRAFIFLMDYANRRRVKLWGRMSVVEDDPALLERLTDPEYRARPERAFVFRVEAWDVNCPAHITPRFTEAQVAEAVAPLQAKIAALEAELARLKGAAGAGGSPEPRAR